MAIQKKRANSQRRSAPRMLDMLEPRLLLTTGFTWTGAVDANWSNNGNWLGGVAPTNNAVGVNVTFDSNTTRFTSTNNLTGLSLGTVTFNNTGVTLNGNAATITGGITASTSANNNIVDLPLALSGTATVTLGDSGTGGVLYLHNVLSGTGNLTKAGVGGLYLQGNNTYAGLTTINAGTVAVTNNNALGLADGTPASQTIVNAGGSLMLAADGLHIGNESLTLDGSGQSNIGVLTSSNVAEIDGTVTIAGTVTLNVINPGTVNLAGGLAGTSPIGSAGNGTVILSGGGSYSGLISVRGTLNLTGNYPSASVNVTSTSLGTLVGSGTVGHLSSVGGTVKPGGSGTAIFNATGGVAFDSNTFVDFNVNGATAGTSYSQLNVAGTVDLGSSALNVLLNAAFTPIAGTHFTLINNDGSDPVVGTFSGLPEGSALTLNGRSYHLSYVGGTGNDVVLTRDAVASAVAVNSTSPSVLGQPIGLVATVTGSGTPTGTVTFFDGASQIGAAAVQPNGTATLNTSTLSVGSHSITGQYSGDATFGPSDSSTFTQVVNKASLAMTLTPNQTLIGPGRFITVNVTAPAAAPSTQSVNGLVLAVLDGSTQIGTVTLNASGHGSTSVQLNTVGVHPLSVHFVGNANFLAGSSQAVNTYVQIEKIYAVGGDTGGAPEVKVFNADGSLRFDFMAYNPAFLGGVRVAVGDVNGDGIPDIITAAGPGGGPHVEVFNGIDLTLITQFFAYAPTFTGGVFVAAGDVNNDGFADIITGAGAGGGPHVEAFSGATGGVLYSFYAYAPTFPGGVHVAAGDVNGDGFADIITGAGAGGGPHVEAFSGADGSLLKSFYAYAPTFSGGVWVTTGDVNNDGKADIITGAGAGGSPTVVVYSGLDNSVLASFDAYPSSFPGGVRVASVDVNGDGHADIITGAGAGGGPHVRVISGAALSNVTPSTNITQFYAFNLPFPFGVFVGAGVDRLVV